MNKELTPLEALERIKNARLRNDNELDDYYFDFCVEDTYKNEVYIVETALKEHKLMKQTKFVVVDKKISDEDLKKLIDQKLYVGKLEQCEIKPLYDEQTQKKLNALEIIKKYEVDYFYLKLTFNAYEDNVIGCERYNERNQDNRTAKILPQEEYELLKEVLL